MSPKCRSRCPRPLVFAAALAACSLMPIWLASGGAAAFEVPSPYSERDPDRLGWYVPDFAVAHTGSYLGALGAGFGYSVFDDVINLSVGYGFTPAAIAALDVHNLWMRGSIRPIALRYRAFRFVPVYLGGGALYAVGDNFFTRLPEPYSEDYYAKTAWMFLGQVGLAVDYLPEPGGAFERHGLYAEVAMHDQTMKILAKELDALRFVDLVASGVGYRMAF